MYILNQNRDCLFNLDKSTFVKVLPPANIYCPSIHYLVVAQIGYLSSPNTPQTKPINEILGRYETEADAQIAFNKILNAIRYPFTEHILEMPPYRTEEEGM